MAKLYWRVKRNGTWTWVAWSPDNSAQSESEPSGWSCTIEESEHTACMLCDEPGVIRHEHGGPMPDEPWFECKQCGEGYA
jgi:hypothetical protein